MQIEEAKEYLKKRNENYKSHKEEIDSVCSDIYGTNNVREYHKKQEAIETVLNELEKKDKVIDEMAAILTRYMSTIDNKPYDLSLGANTRKMTLEEVKEYFNKKVGDK